MPAHRHPARSTPTPTPAAPPPARTPERPWCDCDYRVIEPDEPGAARRADVRRCGRGAPVAGYRGLGTGTGHVDHRGEVAEGTGGRLGAAEYLPRCHRCAVAEGV